MDKPKIEYTKEGAFINGVPADKVRLAGCNYLRAMIDDKPYYVRELGLALFPLGYDESLEKIYITLKLNRGEQ